MTDKETRSQAIVAIVDILSRGPKSETEMALERLSRSAYVLAHSYRRGSRPPDWAVDECLSAKPIGTASDSAD